MQRGTRGYTCTLWYIAHVLAFFLLTTCVQCCVWHRYGGVRFLPCTHTHAGEPCYATEADACGAGCCGAASIGGCTVCVALTQRSRGRSPTDQYDVCTAGWCRCTAHVSSGGACLGGLARGRARVCVRASGGMGPGACCVHRWQIVQYDLLHRQRFSSLRCILKQ